MKGKLSCGVDAGKSLVHLTLHNQTDFDWVLGGAGPYPLRIGLFSLKRADGKVLRDPGLRASARGTVPRGSSATFRQPISGLMPSGVAEEPREVEAELVVAQEGHAWFNAISCRVRFKP